MKLLYAMKGYVVLKRLPPETKQGLVVDTNEEQSNFAELVSVHEDCLMPVGSIVLMPNYGRDITLNNSVYTICKEEDIAAILR